MFLLLCELNVTMKGPSHKCKLGRKGTPQSISRIFIGFLRPQCHLDLLCFAVASLSVIQHLINGYNWADKTQMKHNVRETKSRYMICPLWSVKTF